MFNFKQNLCLLHHSNSNLALLPLMLKYLSEYSMKMWFSHRTTDIELTKEPAKKSMPRTSATRIEQRGMEWSVVCGGGLQSAWGCH